MLCGLYDDFKIFTTLDIFDAALLVQAVNTIFQIKQIKVQNPRRVNVLWLLNYIPGEIKFILFTPRFAKLLYS